MYDYELDIENLPEWIQMRIQYELELLDSYLEDWQARLKPGDGIMFVDWTRLEINRGEYIYGSQEFALVQSVDLSRNTLIAEAVSMSRPLGVILEVPRSTILFSFNNLYFDRFKSNILNKDTILDLHTETLNLAREFGSVREDYYLELESVAGEDVTTDLFGNC